MQPATRLHLRSLIGSGQTSPQSVKAEVNCGPSVSTVTELNTIEGGKPSVVTRKVGSHAATSAIGSHTAPVPKPDLVGSWQWARHMGKPRSETFVETFAPSTTIASSRYAHAATVHDESNPLYFEPKFQDQAHTPPNQSSCSRPYSPKFDPERRSTPETCTPASTVLHNEPALTVDTIHFTQVAASIIDEAQSASSSCSTPLTSHGCTRIVNIDDDRPSPRDDTPIEEAPSQLYPEQVELGGYLSSCTNESDSSQPEDTDLCAPTQRLVYASSPDTSDVDEPQAPTKSQAQGYVSPSRAMVSVVAEVSCGPWAMQERTRRILASCSRGNVDGAQVDPTFDDDAASLAIILWTLVQCYAQC
ncbi:hypothetical protein SPRG_22115 [Saprolegnia parasitica CBS 223.65]|uniref:Uncharacterized protein n=1 Tax=Saprolegnia parasitica (strain CBS 223.65) TaxID=695850 RepID=A0A067CN90_SAPPC|nr:hypothetical protein SPRG_22115 [Saprolegnia parasitica CBS 223.65]KDO31988.1 hypothetical protein SPRG_22115 [Saprolegnia parasitica CBS 223.65]|eukprot:XP_012197417.1 hypothetical protein SPRG_22115 [Saprolegnia parasitica CBS 223.65]